VRIAVASSGLGHVARGIETWAADTAAALAQRGVDVTLFAGGAESGERFLSSRLSRVVLPCLRRTDPRAGRLARRSPGWTWRLGLKSAYGWEQFSFWTRLWPHLRRGSFDILHVQDPMLAWWCRLFRRAGIVTTREILAHGTEEPPEFLARFEFVQHLAPWHLERAGVGCQVSGVSGREGSRHGKPYWTAMPNFVDTDMFRPVESAEEKAACRERLGIPNDAFVIGTAATVKRPHKRIDYLLREFASFAAECSPAPPVSSFELPVSSPLVAVAGARTAESEALVRMGRDLCGDRARFFLDLPRDRMPDFYRALDVFVLVSLFEMMPIAVLEALASGLPVIANRHPVLEWMTGAGEPEGAGRPRPEVAGHIAPTPEPAVGILARGPPEGGTPSVCVGPEAFGVPASAGPANRRGAKTRSAASEKTSCPEAGGACVDMNADGALAVFLRGLAPDWLRARGTAARARALTVFSRDAVIGQYVAYYERVLAA
jgi:glycosyltransferase involved in cell wall biosynthesis